MPTPFLLTSGKYPQLIFSKKPISKGKSISFSAVRPARHFLYLDNTEGLGIRAAIWLEYVRIIQEVQPKAFVFENVAGLKSIHSGIMPKFSNS